MIEHNKPMEVSFDLVSILPISKEAKAIVTMPEPISMLTDFCERAKRAPDKAVKLLDMQRAMMVVCLGSIEEASTMKGLSPVALIAKPILVFRK